MFVSILFQETEEIEDMIADGLSQLGRSADGTLQVYLNLFLAVLRFCFALASSIIQAITTCRHLQNLK